MPAIRRHPHILGDCEVREDAGSLERSTDAERRQLVRPATRNTVALEQHLSGARCKLARDAVEQCGLPRSIGSDHAVQRPLPNSETHVAYRLHPIEMLRYPFALQNGVHL